LVGGSVLGGMATRGVVGQHVMSSGDIASDAVSAAVGGTVMGGALKVATPLLKAVARPVGQALKSSGRAVAGRLAPAAGEVVDSVVGKFTSSYWERLASKSSDLSEAEYFSAKLRPGTDLLFGGYSTRRWQGVLEVQNRARARQLNARTLGTTLNSWETVSVLSKQGNEGLAELVAQGYTKQQLQTVSDEARRAGIHAVMAEEMPYMEQARHIYFYLYGHEGPNTTPITWAELESIFDHPALLKKTTFIYDTLPDVLRDQ